GRVVAEVVDDGGVDGRGRAETVVEVVELGLRGELAEPQEVGHLLEGGVAREVVDLVAAVDELAGLPVDVGQLGVEGGDAFEALGLDRGGAVVGSGRGSGGRHDRECREGRGRGLAVTACAAGGTPGIVPYQPGARSGVQRYFVRNVRSRRPLGRPLGTLWGPFGDPLGTLWGNAWASGDVGARTARTAHCRRPGPCVASRLSRRILMARRPAPALAGPPRRLPRVGRRCASGPPSYSATTTASGPLASRFRSPSGAR